MTVTVLQRKASTQLIGLYQCQQLKELSTIIYITSLATSQPELTKLYNETGRWHVTISCQPDGCPPQPVRPWESGRVHLAEGSNVVVLEQKIRSVELGVCSMQLFHFLITSWKSDDFTLRYGDISIFKMAAVRHLGIVLPLYETTHEVLSNFMSIWYTDLKI